MIPSRSLLPLIFLLTFWAAPAPAIHRQKTVKLPRPVRMDAGITIERNPKTGELELRRNAGTNVVRGSAPRPTMVIRVRTNLVEVNCNVFAPDGSAVRALKEADFRIYQDGEEQQITHFDASSQGASIALVLDASPSVLPDSAAMKSAAEELIGNLSPADEVAVVDFSAHTYLLLPFSRDRGLLRKAVAGVDVRHLFADTGGSNIYRSVYLAAQELFPSRSGRKAIILLTDGQDSGLGLNLDGAGVRPQRGEPATKMTFEDVVRAVSQRGIEVFAISTQNRPRVMTAAWLAAHQNQTLITPAALALNIPAYTAFLAELVRRVGGQLYFLKETGSVAGAYQQIIENLNAQYTLGFYPPRKQQPGWHSLRVEVEGHGAVRAVHRSAYYAPPETP
jgi:Ca-activated chloride channel family protein